VKTLDRLCQFSSIITSTADSQQLYRRVVESVCDAFALDFSTLMLLSPSKERLTIYDTVGFSPSMIGTFFLMQGQGLSTHVVNTKRPEVVADFEQERRFEVPPVVRQFGIRSAICVPMMIDNEPFGVLIGHSLALRKFSKQEQVLFQNMGNLAALAIRNCLNMERIKQAKEFTESVLNSMTEAIAIIQVPEMLVVDANQTFIDSYGGSRAEVVGKLCHVLTHGSDRVCAPPQCGCPVGETMRYGRVCQCEHKHVSADGGTTYYEIITSPIREATGAVSQVVHVQRDITERRLLERQLLQAQKMESVGRLAAGISHDFNNILTAIIGYSQLLLTSLPEDSDEHRYAKVIRDSGQRGSALVKQILTFSRQQSLEVMPVDINRCIQQLSRMLQRIIGDDVLHVLSLREGIPPVLGDGGQIEQVITNLAVNARDAMAKGGVVVIETSHAHLAADTAGRYGIAPGDYIVICVTDTGTGIPKDLIGKIFDPFFTTKEQGRGTGLGLSTAYGIVKQHGGYIDVCSEPESGSTFRVYLPVYAVRER